jgi:hypothetical protein
MALEGDGIGMTAAARARGRQLIQEGGAIPEQALLRLAALATALVLCRTCPPESQDSLVFSIIITHYFVALIYSRRRVVRSSQRPRTLVPLLGLTLGSWFLYRDQVSLVVYFGVHHVFNEVFWPASQPPTDRGFVRVLQGVRVALNACLYLAILRRHPDLAWLDMGWLGVAIVPLIGVYLVLLVRLASILGWSAIVDLASLEGLSLLVLALIDNVALKQVVLYHVLFWGFMPVRQMLQRGDGSAARYGLLNAALVGIQLFISPVGPIGGLMTFWYQEFYLGAYVHISLSFALSSANPGFLIRWLQTSRTGSPKSYGRAIPST